VSSVEIRQEFYITKENIYAVNVLMV